MKRSLVILMTGAAVVGLGAGAALADDTTVVHEQRVVIPAPAQATVQQQTTTQSNTHVAVTTAHRRFVVRHRVRRVAPHHTIAASARPHAIDAAASEQRTTQVQAAAPANPSPTVMDKRTVIHHDDQGDTETHTRVIQQDSNGITTVEHKSTEQSATPDSGPPGAP